MQSENGNAVQRISVRRIRRFLPQIIGSCSKNLMIFNLGEFAVFTSIVIPSLIGLSKELNPDETVEITSSQASWLAAFASIAHPFGSLMSAPICDKIGRRKSIMLVALPLTISWIVLGFAQSFTTICLGFTLIGFLMGLKDSPVIIYVSEISEPIVRGVMMSLHPFFLSAGTFMIMGLGSVFSWRQCAFISAVPPFICLVTLIFIPESPSWLLSKDRPKQAEKSLQWLRGWVSPQTVRAEFTELQNFSESSNACLDCEKQSIKCNHPKPSFIDKIKDLKRKRNWKPAILMCSFFIVDTFSTMSIFSSYLIQILISLGTPIDPSSAAALISSVGFASNVFLLLSIKQLGRRRIYFVSNAVLVLCGIGLSIYGFILLPSGWTSFKRPGDQPLNIESTREMVHNYGYLALAFLMIMQFCTRIGVAGIPFIYLGEVFIFRSRAFMCALQMAFNYFLHSIAKKTYYNVEMWLSLPGAALFYAIVVLIGSIGLYFIMPELEGRSLEDIELHYSDNTKKLIDIHIPKQSKAIE